MLRDPDGNIWSRAFLKTAYNDIQRDVQRKTHILEQVAVLNYPPQYQMSYMHDWEWPSLPSDQTQFFQCWRYHNQSGDVFAHKWEAQSKWGSDSVVQDIGIQFMHPWEAFMGETPCMPIRIRFPSNFHSSRFLAWDRSPIEYRPKKAIMQCDSSWETHTGEPRYYYREDDADNSFVPYPQPSTVSWEDEPTPADDPRYVCTFEWEKDQVTGAEKWTRSDDANEREYLFTFELGHDYEEDFFKGMWLFEIERTINGAGGQVLYLEDDDANTEAGTIIRQDGRFIDSDDGIAVDVLVADNDFFLVYVAEPTDIQDDTDESDFPVFLRKYVEYGVLERAYGALTDGKVVSMKEYWGKRYEIGIEAIKLYSLKKKTDRNYRLMTHSIPARREVRHARLPSNYPAI